MAVANTVVISEFEFICTCDGLTAHTVLDVFRLCKQLAADHALFRLRRNIEYQAQ